MNSRKKENGRKRFIKIVTIISLIIILALTVYKLATSTLENRSSAVVLPTGSLTAPADYFGLPYYPGAKLMETVQDQASGAVVKVSWQSEDPVSRISKWYRDILKDTVWNLIIPPADISEENIQYLRLEKDNYNEFLGISLIADESTGTRIILEKITQAQQQEGEDEEIE